MAEQAKLETDAPATAGEEEVIAAVGNNSKEQRDEARNQLSNSDRITLFFVFFSVFIDMFGLSVIQPILPFYAESFGASPTQLGSMYSSYAGFGLLSSQVMGWISDRFGRRKALLFSILGSAAGYFLAYAANSFWFLLGARCVGGFFSSSQPVAQAAITDVVSAQRRPQFLAGLGSTLALSFVFGPGIGSGLAQFGIEVPFFVSGCLAITGFVLAFFLLRETHPRLVREAMESGEISVSSMRSSSATHSASDSVALDMDEVIAPIAPIVYVIGIFATCTMISFTSYFSMFALFMLEKFGWTSLEIGFSMLEFSLMLMIGQILVFNTLNARFGLTGASIVGSSLVVISLGLLPVPSNVWGTLAVSNVCLPIALGIVMPATTSLIANYSHPTNRGKVLGLGQAFNTTGMVIGPLASGALFAIDIGLPFWLGAGASVISVIVNVSLLAFGYDTCGPPGEEKEEEAEETEPWVWKPDEPTEEDMNRLGRDFGELLIKHNYKWVSYYGKLMETVVKVFPPLRVSSRDEHNKDVRMIVANADDFFKTYAELGEHSKLKFV